MKYFVVGRAAPEHLVIIYFKLLIHRRDGRQADTLRHGNIRMVRFKLASC